ncbi:MAG: gephyrin-like molybdotransferase Glp [Syntrophobacteraceae bacterium]|jgi:molybdopterin molybdotransferase
MAQFLKVKTADEVLSILDRIEPLSPETVSLALACGRRLASDMTAVEAVPHFVRATMDGYAVRARDTFGASESMPALLERSGEVAIGEAPGFAVTPGKAVEIPTGGMLPEGADAVVMVEYTSVLDNTTIEITRPVAPGENVLKAGDDIALGETLFREGALLRPQDVGVLAALGIVDVEVFRVPLVALISTGDEIVPVETRLLAPGKVRDINSFSLAAQIKSAGARIGMQERVSDRLEDLVWACQEALKDHDVIVLSGGSSVGVRDYTTQVLAVLPESELLVHGVAIRPGKPTIFGRAGGVLFWGLPGQPVSALITCQAFVLASLRKLQGMVEPELAYAHALGAILNRQVPSVHGRTDYVPVALSRGSGGAMEASPIFGKSGAISILARADGYLVIPEHVEGLDAGAEVSVFLF